VTLKSSKAKPVSLDQKAREAVSALTPRSTHAPAPGNNLAMLARWYYSSWRDGGSGSPSTASEKICPTASWWHAISRVAHKVA